MSSGIKVSVRVRPAGGGDPRHDRLLIAAAALVEDLSSTYKPADAVLVLGMALGIIHSSQRKVADAATRDKFVACVGTLIDLVCAARVKGEPG